MDKCYFLLLVSLAFMNAEEAEGVRREIEARMRNYFPNSLCEKFSGRIVSGLMT